MENKIEHNTEEHNIIVSEDKVEVVYTNVGAGCMLTGIGMMTLASLVIFFIVPDVSFVKGFFGIIIGIFGLLVFGSMLIRMLTMLLSGRAVITVQDGYVKGRKKSVRISDIKDIQWGGSGFKYIAIRTMNNKKIKLSTYNLVNEQKVHKVLDTYVVPEGTPELKENWAKRYGGKGYKG
ncbi:DUF5381 family protein [Mesobacillus jeotgali]|uniref:DUF5381 family protein n=1 Tax=Mesobacillus jeotgali TaxID=129985 RepID=UPI000C831448|nr:DUF5381 family protein [Mesobacillus jeotgali]